MSGVHVAAATHTGLVRLRNEDSCGITGLPRIDADGQVVSRTLRREGCLVVVADGLGGHPRGDVASEIAVKSLLDSTPANSSDLVQAIHSANRLIVESMLKDDRLTGMGTTIAAILFLHEGIAVANVGDSSVFEFEDGHLQKISVDDVPSNSGGPIGMPTSVVTQTLGGGRTLTAIEPHLFEDYRAGNRRILVCSDGLTNFVHRGDIAKVLRESEGDHAVQALIDRALEAGAPDNVTVVLAEIRD